MAAPVTKAVSSYKILISRTVFKRTCYRNTLLQFEGLQVCYASSITPREFKVPKAPAPKSPYDRGPAKKLSWREEKISQAMKAYMEKRTAHEKFMEEEIVQFQLGKRHLANIMGDDPNTYTQKEIDEAISYLMPSGLFDPLARPMMKHPLRGIPQAKIAQFGVDGRPYHHLFYTGKPNFYTIMFDAAEILDNLRDMDAKNQKINQSPTPEDRMNTLGEWASHEKIRLITKERVSPVEYQKMITLLSKILFSPYSAHAKHFIEKYRKVQDSGGLGVKPAVLHLGKDGRKFSIGQGTRKTARAKVFVYYKGSGSTTVNGSSFLQYFGNLYDREQIAFPLLLTGLLGKVDIVAMVEGGGISGQAGAMRLAVSRAITSAVSQETREKMRLSGLLTTDPRQIERQKPGRHRARKGFTWKRR